MASHSVRGLSARDMPSTSSAAAQAASTNTLGNDNQGAMTPAPASHKRSRRSRASCESARTHKKHSRTAISASDWYGLNSVA